MSQTEHEAEGILYDTRHRHDVFHHSGGPSASAVANAVINGGSGGSGNGSGGTAPFIAAPAEAPYRRPFIGLFDTFMWPEWLENALAALLILVVAVLAAFGLAKLYNYWFSGSDSSKPASVVMTMPRLLASEHFAVNNHALCSYTEVANGTAYKLYLNRGAGCRHTVQAIVPAAKVNTTRSAHFKRNSISFIYNPVKLTNEQVQQLKQLSLGQQVQQHLRNIVARVRK